MTRILSLAGLGALLVLLPSCNCFDFKAGLIKVDTDCAGGTITHSQVTFAQLPGGVTRGQFDKLLESIPAEIKTLIGDVACKQLIDPQSVADLCAPLGVGGGLDTLNLQNAADTRVIMCGSQMFTLGTFPNGMFVCRADDAVIDGQIWFMDCQQFSLSTRAPTGSCQGIVEFDQQVGL
jgi:hypothetical protein